MALRKTCPKCQSPNHCRKSQCAECGYLFSGKKSNKIEMRNKRSKKTMEMCELRKANDRERKARKRASASDSDTNLRRASDRLHKATKRDNASAYDTELRRASNKLCQANKRANQNDCDTVRRREKDCCSTASVRAQSKSVGKVIQDFLAKVKVGPDYVCTCCHRMLYRHAVIGFKPTKYTKASPELLRELSEHAYVGGDGKQWVCKTCDGALCRGNLLRLMVWS